MTFEVKLSQFASKSVFENAVTGYVTRMNAFGKEIGNPRPVAHPLVEASVRRVVTSGKADHYVPDYNIIDDSSPEVNHMLTLAEKKNALLRKLQEAESAERDRVLPKLKTRLANAKHNLAMRVKIDERTGEQNEDIASFTKVQEAWDKIYVTGAQIESDIDDLTEANIDSWVMPPLG